MMVGISAGQKKAPICTYTCAAQTIATRRRALALSVIPGAMTSPIQGFAVGYRMTENWLSARGYTPIASVCALS
jgi:hypothetical protein